MKDCRPPFRRLVLLFALSSIAWIGCSLSSKSSSSNPSPTPTPTPGELAATPSSLQFGTIPSASSKTLSETISNSGGSAVTVSQISTTGTGFSFSGINPPVTLSPGQAATFEVRFAPQTNAAASGSLSISSNASNATLAVALSGSGTSPGQLGVSPASVNFGNVVVGSSQSQTATLSASNGPVTVSSASMTGSEFSVSGLSLPVTIASGSSASFTLTFSPQASGSTSGTLTLVGTALNSGLALSLSGTGTSPPQHSVTLTWNASTSGNVGGYNVYRGTVSDGSDYAKINSVLETSTTSIDSTVVAGHTYYYVVTAVAGSQESGYSNQATALIPEP